MEEKGGRREEGIGGEEGEGRKEKGWGRKEGVGREEGKKKEDREGTLKLMARASFFEFGFALGFGI